MNGLRPMARRSRLAATALRIGFGATASIMIGGCSLDRQGVQHSGLITTGGANYPAPPPSSWQTATVIEKPAPTPPSDDIIVTFATASTILGPEARQALDAYAKSAVRASAQNILVEGRADVRGNDAYNRALALRRANALRDYLIARGVSASQFRVVSYGKDRPIAACPGESCWAWNRSARIIGGARIATRQ